MRIGMDGRCLRNEVGGVRTYTRCLAIGLSKLGHEVKLVADGPLPAEDELPKLTVVASRLGPLKFRRLWQQLVLPMAARRAGAEVLHFPADVGVPRVKACPYVATIHDAFAFVMPDLFEAKQLKSLRGELAATARRCDAIITDSQQSKDDLTRCLGLPENRVTVVPLAPCECFRPLVCRDEMKSAQRSMGLPEKFLLCVGGKNNKYHKNIHRVVEVLGSLAANREFAQIALVIAGKGSKYLETVARRAEELGIRDRLVFTGMINDRQLCLLYNLASALVFPSLYEGFGLPILEAMACGTPVITANHGAMKEVAGDAAILLDPTDVPALAEAIAALVTDPVHRSEIAARGLARARDFSCAKTAEKTADVFASVRR